MCPTHTELLDKYMRELAVVQSARPNTVRAYQSGVTKLITHLETAGMTLLNAKREHLVDWIETLRGGVGARSACVALAAVRNLYRWLEDTQQLTVSPVPRTLAIKTKRQDPVDVPTVEQFLAIRRQLESGTNTCKHDAAFYVHPIVETLAGAGLRLGALLSLRSTHLRLAGSPAILVDARDMDCKGSHAGSIPLAPYAARVLSEHLARFKPCPDKPLFAVSERTVRNMLENLSPHGLHLHPHSLRHFYCAMTYFRNFEGGRHDVVWVRDAAGHANLATTDTYLRVVRRVCASDSLWETWACGRPAEQSAVKSLAQEKVA